jgi:rubrerythrin
MSHDDAVMYERAIREGHEKETKGRDIRKMNCQEMNDEGVMCDFCEVSHLSDYDCDENILANMILDVDRKVNDQWEMNYKSIDNISKRTSMLELEGGSIRTALKILEREIGKCVTGKMIFEMRQTIETWQRGCEVQLNVLMKCNQELEQRLNRIENEPSYKQIIDDIIGEIGKLKSTKDQADLVADHYIKTESRLEKLEGYMEMEDRVTATSVLRRIEEIANFCNTNWKHNRRPHKCPVCDGKYITIFKECESACLACDKGIVWG